MLISPNNAVVSLGVSCQTATQVHAHHRLFSAALGDPELVHESSFFDYIVTPLQAATSLFAAGDFTEVRQDDISRRSRACWTRHGLYFWHGGSDPQGQLSKYTHLLQKLRKLREIPNLVFVVSNTQSNLSELQRKVGGFDTTFDLARIDALMQAVEGCYDRPCRFVVVSNPALGVLPHAHGRMRSAVIDHPEATWHGHVGAWHLAIRQSLQFYEGIPRVQIREQGPAPLEGGAQTRAEASASAKPAMTPTRKRWSLPGWRPRFARHRAVPTG